MLRVLPTVKLAQTVVDSKSFAGALARNSTFSRTAGELDEELDLPPARRSKAWIWAAAAGPAAILVVGAVLLLRSGGSPKPIVATPPAAEVVEPDPLPVAVPPVLPAVPVAAPSEQPEIKPQSPPPSAKPLVVQRPKKSRHTVTPERGGNSSDGARMMPTPPLPAEKPKKGTQDEWRLD